MSRQNNLELLLTALTEYADHTIADQTSIEDKLSDSTEEIPSSSNFTLSTHTDDSDEITARSSYGCNSQSNSLPKRRKFLPLFDEDMSAECIIRNDDPTVPVFLETVHPFSRRQMLAFHTQFIKVERRSFELISNDVVVKREPTLPMTHYSLADSESERSTNHELPMNLMWHCMLTKDLSGVNYCMTDEEWTPAVVLNEPMSIRSNIYDKFFIHFQNFYNEHDGLAIYSLLMIPCCTTDVARDVFIWAPQYSTSQQYTTSINKPCYTFNVLKMTVISNCKKLQTLPQRLNVVLKRTVRGEECYRGGFDYLFRVLPDSIFVFKSVECHHHSRGTIVIASFSYFFTLTLPGRSSEGSGGLSTTTEPRCVQIEVIGCHVNYYNLESDCTTSSTQSIELL